MGNIFIKADRQMSVYWCAVFAPMPVTQNEAQGRGSSCGGSSSRGSTIGQKHTCGSRLAPGSGLQAARKRLRMVTHFVRQASLGGIWVLGLTPSLRQHILEAPGSPSPVTNVLSYQQHPLWLSSKFTRAGLSRRPGLESWFCPQAVGQLLGSALEDGGDSTEILLPVKIIADAWGSTHNQRLDMPCLQRQFTFTFCLQRRSEIQPLISSFTKKLLTLQEPGHSTEGFWVGGALLQALQSPRRPV